MAVALSRARPCADVKGDNEQWEDLSAGTGDPWEDHGPCHKKTRMGGDVLALRMRFRLERKDAGRKAWGRMDTESSCPGVIPRLSGSGSGILLNLEL